MSTTTPGDHEQRSAQLDGLVGDDNSLQLVELTPGMWINPRAIACLRHQPNAEDLQQGWTEILFTSGEVRHTPTGVTPSLIVDRLAELQAIANLGAS